MCCFETSKTELIIFNMSDRNSENSEEQGFIPNKIQIQPQPGFLEQKESTITHIFQPHYLLGTPMLRKEPLQCYSRFQDIPSLSTEQTQQIPPQSMQTERLTAYQMFNNSDRYLLLYSRLKQPLGIGPKAAFQNQLILKSTPHRHFQITRTLRPWSDQYPNETSKNELIFDSKFEGGNLLSAYKSLKQKNTYILFMQNDTNTYGYNQWFYFSVKNLKVGNHYTFKIVNFKKKYSFFRKGMQPFIFSLERARKKGNGWYRDGSKIKYYQSSFEQIDCPPYYTLQFEIAFEYQNDYITISANPPYSYSRLMSALTGYKKKAEQNGLTLRIQTIAKSLGGNQVPYAILSNGDSTAKNNIIILGRQHSGQIWSSFLIQQMLEKLICTKETSSTWLLQHYNFHIFPMVNVDGVIYGNFRCDIAGYDLNRCWKEAYPMLFPQLCKIKEILGQMAADKSIDYCFDFHTHSKQYGVFAYCCVDSQACRAIPLLLRKNTSLFRYRSCTFGIAKDKKLTARASIYDITKIDNVITIEMSTFGTKKINERAEPFSIEDMKTLAKAVLNSIYEQKHESQLNFYFMEKNLAEDEYQEEHPVSGSDSDPEIDQIQTQVKFHKIFPKSYLPQSLSPTKKKKKKTFKPYIVKKSQNWKSKTEYSEPSQINLTKVKSRYNQSIYYKKRETSNPRTQQQEQIEVDISFKSPKPTKLSSSLQLSPQVYQTVAHKSKFFSGKKQLADKQKTPLNMFQFSLKNLPIFNTDALPQSYQALTGQNHSLMMTSMGLTLTEKASKTPLQRGISTYSNFNNTSSNSFQFKLAPGKRGQIRDLPYLCIMSDNKKNEHLQKLRERREVKKTKVFWEPGKRPKTEKSDIKEQGILEKLSKSKKEMNCETISKRMIQNFKKYQIRSNKY